MSKLTKPTKEVNNYLNLRWKNRLAIQRVYEIIDVVRKEPDALDASVNGCAIWKNVKGWYSAGVRWKKFEVRDVSTFIHERPAPHADFWFMTIEMDISDATLCKALSVSESFTYYKVGHEFSAGCHFYGASIVSVYCALMVAHGKMTVRTAQSKYAELIMASAGELKEANEIFPNTNDKKIEREVAKMLKW